jgi:hypothetical protein
MEPFDVQCETCHTRLRVRHERFLDQIHPCPKCGSMVHVALPASLMAVASEVADGAGVRPIAGGGAFAAHLAQLVGQHAVLWSVCGAVLVVTGGLAVSWLTGDGDEIVAQAVPPAASAHSIAADVQTTAAEYQPLNTSSTADDKPIDDMSPAATASRSTTTVAWPPLPKLPPDDATDRDTTDSAIAKAPAEEPSTSMVNTAAEIPAVEAAEHRTLRLDPLEFDPSRAHLANRLPLSSPETTSEYAPAVQSESVDVASKLELRIASIDLPAMPLGEFLEMLSTMAALPIQLDPAAGISPQLEVRIRAEDVAIGALLDDVLAQHELSRQDHDGTLLIVRSPAPGP